MRAEFPRDGALGDHGTRLGGQRHLLQVYLDLTGEDGPIHARATYDAGLRFTTGEPARRYQINTPTFLRSAIAVEVGEAGYGVRDPRSMPAHLRGDRYELLCDGIRTWSALTASRQVALATVLNKLGLWDALAEVTVDAPAPADCATPEEAALTTFRANALFKSGRASRPVFAQLTTNSRLPAADRVDAAINQIVHLARVRVPVAEMDHFRDRALTLTAATPASMRSPLRTSIQLRGLSFVPFLRGERAAVRAMLDDAEAAARAALTAGSLDPLLAVENLHPLLETRAKEAEWVGQRDLAEHRYRELTSHDPHDAKVWVRLGDFLHRHGRPADALAPYLRAATLGAPFTAYALTQAARCLSELDRPTEATAYLNAATRADPAAVTPLVLLADIGRRAGVEPRPEWATQRLQRLRLTIERKGAA